MVMLGLTGLLLTLLLNFTNYSSYFLISYCNFAVVYFNLLYFNIFICYIYLLYMFILFLYISIDKYFTLVSTFIARDWIISEVENLVMVEWTCLLTDFWLVFIFIVLRIQVRLFLLVLMILLVIMWLFFCLEFLVCWLILFKSTLSIILCF